MRDLDPRAQLAWLAAVVVSALAGGDAGLTGAGAVALSLVVAERAGREWLRLLWGVLPLALLVGAIDALAGQLGDGLRVGSRMVVLATCGLAFARVADGEALVAGMRALRVPYSVVFVLVAGAQFIPTTASDLSDLRDSARLRGIALDGPPWQQLQGWRVVLVPLLVGTVRRGLQLGEAMEARAFGAAARRTIRRQLRWRLRDSLAMVLAIAYLAVVVLVAR